MTTIIGLSGYARSGKDTVASLLKDYDYRRFAFADRLKEAVYRLNPVIDYVAGEPVRLDRALEIHGPEKTKELFTEYRRLLQAMGTEVGREMFGENFWVDLAIQDATKVERAVFTDCRFPNEAKAIKDLGGQVWRIRRPGYGPVNDHPSETSLDGWDFDYVLDNEGDRLDLALKVAKLMLARNLV